jgi:hypothetical protein
VTTINVIHDDDESIAASKQDDIMFGNQIDFEDYSLNGDEDYDATLIDHIKEKRDWVCMALLWRCFRYRYRSYIE